MPEPHYPAHYQVCCNPHCKAAKHRLAGGGQQHMIISNKLPFFRCPGKQPGACYDRQADGSQNKNPRNKRKFSAVTFINEDSIGNQKRCRIEDLVQQTSV